ncbi:efflux RND transporter permease subunit [Reinekea marinisedimentorum]|uniref:Multidrug efflux pump subunit AcrB n=1 Tax=Reinekea marinisedimentorum TaxID=230495 RepID=A0A4R3ID31_9GAMM|nr:efflux RND transporter permease subunit [Reinekea marinisedimentorum]TCS43337.1 multidrug efflux pump subunit AcrB [Reinekea marinisedimentorum]
MSENQHLPGEGIIGWFARNSVAANLLLISTIIMGVLSLNELRKESFPSLDPDRVTISVSYDSGDPQQAEEGIALKIEEALESVAGIDRITTTSNSSGASVMVEKESDYPLDDLYDDIKTQVDAINDFPSDADNPIISKATREEHAIWVQLYGDADRETFQDLAERIKSDLLSQSAIRDLDIKATADPVIAVELDEAKLQAYGLSFSDVSDAINAESSSSSSTSLRNNDKVVQLTVSEQAYNQQDFVKIPLLTLDDGTQIYLGDVANVRETFDDDSYTLSRYNGQSGMAIEIVMDEFGDVTNIVDQANAVVAQWNAGNALPENVELVTWYDSSTLILERLSLLVKNALSGIALVFIVLALFLNLRVAIWVAAGLPFVFFGALYFMTDSFMGLTINEMTTFGFIMALGIVVDDAVVVGESIYSTRRSEGDTIQSTIRGTLRVAVPTLFGVFTTVAAFVSLSNVEGPLGQIYAQFGTIVTICLLLSMVESKLILPSHLAHVNTHRDSNRGLWNKIQHGCDSGLQWFSDKIYRKVIKLALANRYAVVILFGALFVLVIGMPLTGKVRISFFPDVEGDTISGEVSMYADASFGQTESALLQLENAAMQADKILTEKYGGSESGIASIQVLAESDSSGELAVEMSANAAYGSNELAKEWTALAGNPEGVKKVSIAARRRMVDAFKVEIKAFDDETVFAVAEAFKEMLENTEGVSGIDDNMSPGVPQYRFELNEQGRALGIETADLASQLLLNFGGSTVQSFQRDSDEVEVQVGYPEDQRQTLADVMNAMIRTDSSVAVPLSSIATVYTDYQQSDITRIDAMRAIYITADVDKDIIASNELVALFQNTLVPEMQNQYTNLVIDFAGEAEQQAETASSMSTLFVLALIAIYALLAVPLRSYIQPLLIMMAIPFGVVGAILGHYFNGLTISILSLFGILALSGVVVNDSLLLVSTFNEIMKDKSTQVRDAIVMACTGRLRAVLLTSVTTFAGLAPLLQETSTQAQFIIPAAASLGYGILFATIITLVLIPALLLINYEVQTLLRSLVARLTGRKLATS